MNYEQRYKEALERARQFSEHPLCEDSSNIVEYIFPELKEGMEVGDIPACLEKQGKKPKWSEEDEEWFNFTMDYLDNGQQEWLNSLKQRMEEWI